MNHRENLFLDAAQTRIYRRTLGLAPPYVAQQKGLEYIKNQELLNLVKAQPWSRRVKRARVRLLQECRAADWEEPIHRVLYEQDFSPKKWEGRILLGASQRRGSWLQTAISNESEITDQ